MKKLMKNKNSIIVISLGVLFVLFLILILLFGTGKTVKCSSKSDQSKNGYVMETEYIINSSGKNVRSVKISEVITSKQKDILEKFEKQLRDQYEYNKKSYGGYRYKVVNRHGKVTTSITIDYSKFDMKKFVKNNQAMKKYIKDNKLTLDGAKELYKSTGATCK